MSYILHATSPRVYKRLLEEELMVLPSLKTLRKITMRLHRKSGLDDTQYLRTRYSQLNVLTEMLSWWLTKFMYQSELKLLEVRFLV